MGTVNMNFDVLQTWNKSTGEDMLDRGRSVPRYDKYEWRDYKRDNIDGDGRSRYQLYLNDRYDYKTFERASMEADKQTMINEALADEKRVAARAAARAAQAKAW
jgi:hypothetical protein